MATPLPRLFHSERQQGARLVGRSGAARAARRGRYGREWGGGEKRQRAGSLVFPIGLVSIPTPLRARPQAPKVNRAPTFEVTTVSGILRRAAAMKFAPEQCMGSSTSGFSAFSSSTVCSM